MAASHWPRVESGTVTTWVKPHSRRSSATCSPRKVALTAPSGAWPRSAPGSHRGAGSRNPAGRGRPAAATRSPAQRCGSGTSPREAPPHWRGGQSRGPRPARRRRAGTAPSRCRSPKSGGGPTVPFLTGGRDHHHFGLRLHRLADVQPGAGDLGAAKHRVSSGWPVSRMNADGLETVLPPAPHSDICPRLHATRCSRGRDRRRGFPAAEEIHDLAGLDGPLRQPGGARLGPSSGAAGPGPNHQRRRIGPALMKLMRVRPSGSVSTCEGTLVRISSYPAAARPRSA